MTPAQLAATRFGGTTEPGPQEVMALRRSFAGTEYSAQANELQGARRDRCHNFASDLGYCEVSGTEELCLAT